MLFLIKFKFVMFFFKIVCIKDGGDLIFLNFLNINVILLWNKEIIFLIFFNLLNVFVIVVM